MRKTVLVAALLLLVMPVVARADGFRDLDSAMSAISRGFERGESSAITSGIASGEQVQLQFPGLISESGFFGKDQASYLLDELFDKTHPSGFQQVSARKVSAEGQYHITANWTINRGGKAETRDLYITLRNKSDRWSIVSIRSGGK